MAGPINLTETDFEEIRQNLVDYLKSTEKYSDYDFEGSNLQVILNLLSYQAQLNAYSVNMVANESFLASSSIRNNVVSNARQVGYLPHSARSSNALISFSFDLKSGLDIDSIYPQGLPSTLQVSPGFAFAATTSEEAFTFNTVDTYTAAVTSEGICTFVDIPIYQGTRLSKTFTKDETEYNQVFILDNKNIDTTTIRVEVQEDPNKKVNFNYTQALNITELTSDSRVFWLEEIQEGYYELTFGDGMFGKALQDGATIYCDYVVSDGQVANGIKGNNSFKFTGVVVDTFGTTITVRPTVTDVSTTDGGAPIEDVPSIKFRAPKFYGSQNRCVTTNDYEAIIREVYPGIDDMYVFGGETLPIPEFGRVYIVIKPLSGDKLSNSSKTFIKNSLQNYRIASLDIKIVDPQVLYVETQTMIYYDDTKTKKDNSGIIASAKEALVRYSEMIDVARFGGTIRYSRIVGVIDDSDFSIVRNVSSLRMRKNLVATIDTAATYEICFENPVKVDYDNPVLYSTGFKIGDDEEIYYFENIPPGIGETTCKLQRFHFDSLNDKVVDDTDFGDFDIVTGEVMLGVYNPLTVSETTIQDDIIEIRALPLNNGQNIKSEGTVYMELDVSKSEIGANVEREVTE